MLHRLCVFKQNFLQAIIPEYELTRKDRRLYQTPAGPRSEDLTDF